MLILTCDFVAPQCITVTSRYRERKAVECQSPDNSNQL